MKPSLSKITRQSPVAIIGIGCLFPKASGLKGYWRLLFRGIDGITDVPDTHWSLDDYYDSDPARPDHVYCRRGGFLSAVDFDPAQFGIPPALLEATDTSQLLGLVTAQMALDNAGYGRGGRSFDRQRTSVILGVTGTQELVIPLGGRLGHPIWSKALEDAGISPQKREAVVKQISDAYVPWQESSFPGLLGNVVAGRICNRLDLGGTNCVVDAACASSLSAVHMATMELESHRCDMVLTGGVDTLNDIFMHMCFSKTHLLSPSGDVRPFSQEADGTVLGEGIGIMVLKRLADAEQANDRIYAVIRGMGSSSDGRSQSIYAPRRQGQVKALENAYAAAGVACDSVELIEAHGTGTRVGDRTEIEALCQVFSNTAADQKPTTNRCALGSVKSNIGHTKAASGSAGVIKAALSLYNKVQPPTLKAHPPDPDLPWQESPFYLNTEPRPWLNGAGHPRRSGVSAFGFGGSNFHMVLEEYDGVKREISWDGSVEIVAFSADNPQQIEAQLADWRAAVSEGFNPTAVARRAAKSRNTFRTAAACRLTLVLDLTADAPKTPQQQIDAVGEVLLQRADQDTWESGNAFFGSGKPPGKVAFLYPGQGSQYAGMARDLSCVFPQLLEALETFNGRFEGDVRLSDHIYPPPAGDKKERQSQEERLRQTQVAQPAIGAVSLGMTRVLAHFGLSPNAVCGHSYGELPALHTAGCIDFDSTVTLSILRGRYMAAAGGDHARDPGTMLAVKAPLDQLDALVRESDADVILANRNSPSQGVLSGSSDAIGVAEKLCKSRKFRTVRLPVAAAFHSRRVEGAQKPFKQALEGIEFNAADLPVFANTTGTPYPDDPLAAKKLLAGQILQPVDFVSDIENMHTQGVHTFLEVGPRAVLSGLTRAILTGRDFKTLAVDGSSGKRFGLMDLARVLCHMAALGHPIDLKPWEDSGSTPPAPKPRMKIPISGANHRRDAGTTPSATTQPAVSKPENPSAPSSALNTPLPTPPPPQRSGSTSAQAPPPPPHPPQITPSGTDPLAVVHEGLKAMQNLQMQTAEAHQKFLDVQTEAGRALQQLMASTRRLAEASMGIDPALQEAGPSPIINAGVDPSISIPDQRIASVPPPPPAPPTVSAVIASTEMPMPAAPVPEPAPSRPQADTPSEASITAMLLEVVSELTGYPQEMLDLDMEIEADLGIDSIKRVEILSAVETKMPHLPAVAPDVLGSLKTLAQISAQLQQGARPEASADPTAAPSVSSGAVSPARDLQPELPAKISATLLAVVAELTGYPVEMLDLDMDIEADLGIDSIKRVEILSAVETQMPDLPAVPPDVLGTLKTLGQIIEYLTADPGSKSSPGDPNAEPTTMEHLAKTHDPCTGLNPAAAEDPASVERYELNWVQTHYAHRHRLALTSGARVIVTADDTGLSHAIDNELQKRSIATAVVSAEAVGTHLDNGMVGGLIVIAPHQCADPGAFVSQAFGHARHWGPQIVEAARGGAGFFATVTRQDGVFGCGRHGDPEPILGALSGLAKTAAREWQDVRCCAFDAPPTWSDLATLARKIVDDIFYGNPSGPVEIGLNPELPADQRMVAELLPAPFSAGGATARLDLKDGDVVLITGGARGVTAAAAHALGGLCHLCLVLVGRSPAPFDEPSWLAPITEEAALKKAIITHDFSGNNTSPQQVERAYQRYRANREIGRHLTQFKATGADVHYHCVDIRDRQSVSNLLSRVHTTLGPVRALIHGAGILADRRIVDKTDDQFKRVFDTKVKGLHHLLEATADDELRYLVLFSSVTARIGNAGQADYAMANEALNKFAQRESRRRPGCKVSAINWGPWDGGMVTAGLKREFGKRGVNLIPVAIGAQCLLREMAGPSCDPVEVVIGSRLDADSVRSPDTATAPGQAPPGKDPDLALAFKREIDTHSFPILKSHVLDGVPVVPFALMAEWFGHGALHANPGLFLQGLDDMRLLKGIRLDHDKKLIRLMAGKPTRSGDVFQVKLEIRDGMYQGLDLIHTRARAILSEQLSPSPVFEPNGLGSAPAYNRDIDEIYEQILFHGNGLRGLKRIVSYSDEGMVAELASAPRPRQWICEPLRSNWIADPLVLDSAFQMASLWCYESQGMVSLPSYAASYRLYCHRFPEHGVTAFLQVKEVSRRKMIADITFVTPEETVIAHIKGYEAVMDPSLMKAFKPQGGLHHAQARS